MDDSFKDFINKEYFVTYGNDTSAVSLIVKEYNESVKILVYTLLDTKLSFSSSIHRTSHYRVTSYSGMLEELELCLDAASLSFDISKAAYIDFFLGGLGDVAVQTVNTMMRQGKTVRTCRHADIDAALARTSFRYDIDKLVCKYGMRVKSIESTEEFMIVSGEDFVEKNLLSPFLKKPKDMIDVCILVGLDGAPKKLK